MSIFSIYLNTIDSPSWHRSCHCANKISPLFWYQLFCCSLQLLCLQKICFYCIFMLCLLLLLLLLLFHDDFSLSTPREESQARVDGVCSLAWLATRILGELTHMNRCYCLRIHVADKCVQPSTKNRRTTSKPADNFKWKWNGKRT